MFFIYTYNKIARVLVIGFNFDFDFNQAIDLQQ